MHNYSLQENVENLTNAEIVNLTKPIAFKQTDELAYGLLLINDTHCTFPSKHYSP